MKKLVVADSRKLKMEMLRFYKYQYRENPLKRDSMSGLFKGILFQKSEMSKAVRICPVMVKDGEKIILSAVLANVDRMKEYMQISFFESPEYDVESFGLLMAKAVSFGKELGCEKISASLNIHVNYGLGFLEDNYDKPQSFGMAHNPAHIHPYFKDYGFKKIELVTFKKDMDALGRLVSDNLRRRLNSRYSVRVVDFSNLKEEAATYTRINNDAFKDHPFYYRRIPKEDLELFRDFKHILKPENLLFVRRDGVDIGFMLWYPDFHQIMGENSTMGIGTVLKTKLYGNKIDTFKIVEMGVVRSEQGKGAILALFDHCQELTKGRYKNFESGWVMKENLKSRAFGDKWSDGESKTYAAYEMELV